MIGLVETFCDCWLKIVEIIFFDRVEELSSTRVPSSLSNAMGPSETLADCRHLVRLPRHLYPDFFVRSSGSKDFIAKAIKSRVLGQ